MNTKVWEVRAALLTVFTAAMPAGIEVSDGPMTRIPPPKLSLLIGTDGGDDGFGSLDDGALARQRRSSLGPGTWRDEEGAVVCSAWAWSGARKFDLLRSQVKDLVDRCEAAVGADRSLGGVVVTQPAGAEVTEIAFREDQFTKGAYVRASFTVAYTALIT
jgi:hypothetical protein